MTKRTWHVGPPLHIGWWNASLFKDPEIWRWWDGIRWSDPCFEHFGLQEVAVVMAMPLDDNKHVQWTDYYPKNARVPRIDPRVGGAK